MLWIGLVGVRPRDGNAFLGGARGAFVRLLAMARDESHYLLQMRQTLEEFRFDFDEVTAVEPYAEFVSREGMAVDLSEVADKVSRDGYTRFGEFFAYEADDA
jgi:hypothetical protein